MTARDTTSGARAANRQVIKSLLENRHARKDMLNGLFQEHFGTTATIRCELEDHIVHLNPCDSTITTAVLEKGHWNRDELERAVAVLRAHGSLREAGFFLDVGANIGTQTLYALRSGAFAGVHAFEPEDDNARLFEMNMNDNALTEVAHLFRHAVGGTEGTVTLHRHPHNAGAHSIAAHQARDSASGVMVPMITLDKHMQLAKLTPHQVGLVWIDVEGAEPGVVAGARELVAARVPMVFEFLDRDRKRSDFADMFAQLRSMYSHTCCLQDERMTVMDSSTLGSDLPEGDYLMFSKHD